MSGSDRSYCSSPPGARVSADIMTTTRLEMRNLFVNDEVFVSRQAAPCATCLSWVFVRKVRGYSHVKHNSVDGSKSDRLPSLQRSTMQFLLAHAMYKPEALRCALGTIASPATDWSNFRIPIRGLSGA